MSTAVAFDTLKFARRLKEAGIPEVQAEAFSDAFREVQESHSETLSTKSDIKELRGEIREFRIEFQGELREVRAEMRLLRWMLALIIAATVLPHLKTLFQ